LVANFCHFCEKKIKNILLQISFSLSSPKIITIAYNMKGCLRFSTFIFWISPNLSKYTYGLSPLEQHQKFERKNNCLSKFSINCPWEIFIFNVVM
jgi:hypothetical protein